MNDFDYIGEDVAPDLGEMFGDDGEDWGVLIVTELDGGDGDEAAPCQMYLPGLGPDGADSQPCEGGRGGLGVGPGTD